MRSYRSLEDIDKHLKVLRLKADISKQKAEIDLKFIKHKTKPTKLMANFFGILAEKQFYILLVNFFLKKFNLK